MCAYLPLFGQESCFNSLYFFLTMSALQVSLIQDAIPDFWKQNYKFFTNEDNLTVLNSMENLQDEIVKFEHMLVCYLLNSGASGFP